MEKKEKPKEKTRKVEIEVIRQGYLKIAKSYSLPDFEKLREDFDIDKTLETEDSFLLRDIRRTIVDKLSGYLHLFEGLINPSNSPMFVFSFMKTLSEKDKAEIKDIYKELSRMQIASMKLDTVYSEKSEALAVQNYFSDWQKLKKRIYSLVENFEKEFERISEEKNKSYFG
ncbi:Uncharacterised protein [uncultured archaeon]|nr:Uncharacterised protein [uncultured archaeon]